MNQQESAEQKALFQWAAYNIRKHPELSLLYHVPNGGKRDIITAKMLKDEGVKPGVPDLFLPVPRRGYHGLYIEMKIKGGKLSDDQKKWIFELKQQGYMVLVCYGWEEASKNIINYLAEVKTEDDNGISGNTKENTLDM
jgi:hypothetical protein